MLDRRTTSDSRADELPGFSRRRWDEIPERLERDFDRRALIPRFMVLVVLGVGAFLEYGHGHRLAHWVVLVVYGSTTVALAIWSKSNVRRSWLPWAATVIDAGLTVYVIADHLPRDAHDALHATDAVSLLPALLLLLQTGLRLRRDLVVFFAGIVALGWLASLWLFVGSDTRLATSDETTVATRQAHSFLSFGAAAGFVLYGVHRMRVASSAALRARFDPMLLSRFLPEGVAADVVRSDGTGQAAERDACLLSVDVRGFSALARERPSVEVVARLMAFRQLVHDAVSGQQGIVDKYLGDGVLALFLEGAPADQAGRALRAIAEIVEGVEVFNEAAAATGHPPLRVIAALHRGRVLAGVFDDGRRAEFTVLGPAMNALPRLERRAKEAGIDLIASTEVLEVLSAADRALLDTTPLERRPGDIDLPEVVSVKLRRSTSEVRRDRAGLPASGGRRVLSESARGSMA